MRTFRLPLCGLAAAAALAGCDATPTHQASSPPANTAAATKTPGKTVATATPAAMPPTAADKRSVYTSIAEKDCKTIHTDAEGGGSVQSCPGHADIPVLVKSGDLRTDIDAGVEGEFKTLGQFNRAGDQLEWRLDDAGKPVAIIYRLTTEDGKKDIASYLVVERIGTKAKPACWIGFVKGSTPDANSVARQKADAHASAPCLGDVGV